MRIACWQAATPGRANSPVTMLNRLAEAARRAAADGAELLVTPELFASGYPLGRRRSGWDEFTDGAARVAADNGLAIVYGWPEPDGDVLYNTATLVDATGTVRASYRKVHLYGEGEQSVFTRGDDPLVQATIGGVTVGLAICYDVEFPELVRGHAVGGTDVLAVPTALMRPWEFVAHTLLPARAFESQLYIAYANWAGGYHNLTYTGLSQVVDPHGRATVAGRDDEELLVADAPVTEIGRARSATPYLTDRRPGLYRP